MLQSARNVRWHAAAAHGVGNHQPSFGGEGYKWLPEGRDNPFTPGATRSPDQRGWLGAPA